MDRPPGVVAAHLTDLERTALVRGLAEYQRLYRRSLDDLDAFWSEMARKYLVWEKEWDFVLRHDIDEAKVEWFGGGLINAARNCVDRHAESFPDKIAYYWDGDSPGESRALTYADLAAAVNKMAALLKSRGVKRGDRVVIYMPTIPELPVAMLACARIGAIHTVVFTEFGAESLAYRIQACGAAVVVTSDGGYQAGRRLLIKEKVDEALRWVSQVHTVVVVNRCGLDLDLDPSRELWWHEAQSDPFLPSYVPPVPMDAEEPLFILFAGTSVGKPRPLVHTHGGYLLWAAMTTQLIFDLRANDTFWSAHEVSSIEGHTFAVYGALANGVTAVLYEGLPHYPNYSRYGEILDSHRVDKFCAPLSAIRVMTLEAGDYRHGHDLSSLKILGTATEPMTAEIWWWYFEHIGRGRCPIMQTWWQPETGGPVMTPLPGVASLKPGSVSFPFFGVAPVIFDLDTCEEAQYPNQEGAFFIGRPWPGMARTVYGDHGAYRDAYYSSFPGLFMTGNVAKRDEEGYYWISGRIDDIIKVSGHRVGAREIESVLMGHPLVNEAVAVGVPHPLKGEGIYLFVILRQGAERNNAVRDELRAMLESHIGTIAIPDYIQWSTAFPKTRSGKVLRRLLQDIAEGNIADLGDMTTVANPDSVEDLINERVKIGALIGGDPSR